MYAAAIMAVLNAKTTPELHEKRVVRPPAKDAALEYSYFEILTAACVDMIRSDGHVGDGELDFLRDLLGLDPDEAEKLAATQGYTNYRRIFSFLTEREKEELLSILLECAEEAGANPTETAFLTQMVGELRLPASLEKRALERIAQLSAP